MCRMTAGKARGLCPQPACGRLKTRICGQLLAERVTIFNGNMLKKKLYSFVIGYVNVKTDMNRR